MITIRWHSPSILIALLVTPFTVTNAQEYPNKVIRIVVPFPPASASDVLARSLGQSITRLTGQNVVIDNRPGANGVIAGTNVAKSAPDGYTFMIGTHTTHAANRWLFKNVPYDADNDFQPVTALAKGWAFLVVNAKSPVKNVAALIDKAKQAPDTVTYGGGGATSRISVEQFAQSSGIKVIYVNYKGNPQAVQDLLAGTLDFLITDSTSAMPHIKNGTLRALAFSGAQRSPTLPDVPTLDEAGVKGYDYYYWQAAYVAAKTPEPIVNKLNDILRKAMDTEVVKAYLSTNGVVSFLSTPQELARFQKEQSDVMGKIIRAAGIEPQ